MRTKIRIEISEALSVVRRWHRLRGKGWPIGGLVGTYGRLMEQAGVVLHQEVVAGEGDMRRSLKGYGMWRMAIGEVKRWTRRRMYE